MKNSKALEIDETGNCAFAFIFILENPCENFSKLGDYFCERQINIDWLQYQLHGDLGKMIVYCRFEKDRMKNIVQVLKNWSGAMSVEWMGAKSGKV